MNNGNEMIKNVKLVEISFFIHYSIFPLCIKIYQGLQRNIVTN